MHITLVRFDTRETADVIRARLDDVLPAQLGFDVRIGPDAQSGRNGSALVSLVEPEPALLRLHTAAMEALGPHVHLPGAQHNRSNCRPHVTHAETRLLPGEQVRIRQAALVDLRPNHDPRLRRVVDVWDTE